MARNKIQGLRSQSGAPPRWHCCRPRQPMFLKTTNLEQPKLTWIHSQHLFFWPHRSRWKWRRLCKLLSSLFDVSWTPKMLNYHAAGRIHSHTGLYAALHLFSKSFLSNSQPASIFSESLLCVYYCSGYWNNTSRVPGLANTSHAVISVRLINRSGMIPALKDLTAFSLRWVVDFPKSKACLLLCILIALGFLIRCIINAFLIIEKKCLV